MSKAEKMRSRLASMQKDREEYEKQKKHLEADMNHGHHHLEKIQKGLKNNVVEHDEHNHVKRKVSSSTSGSQQHMDINGKRPSVTEGGSGAPHTGTGPGSSNKNGPGGGHGHIMPSGPRVSDWCFVGPLESAPPTVKSRALYENVRLLGRGTFGEVNLVKNKEDNKLFAIKTMFCKGDSELQEGLKEIRMLRCNRHPCIIDVHDACITSNPRVLHIVMHYCESGNLSTVLSSAKQKRQTIPESQIIKWTLQLGLAVEFLHQGGFLHRDLKPMNVMLTDGGDLLKLADFGLTIDMKTVEQTTAVDEAGTPYYTAPEIIKGEQYSFPADCWAFGVILYQMLCLERPFTGSSTADLVKAILNDDVMLADIPMHYSDEIRIVCLMLLYKHPEDRLAINDVLEAPVLHSRLAAFPASYRPKSLEERIRRDHIKLLEHQIETINKTALKNAAHNLELNNGSVDRVVGGSERPDAPLSARPHAHIDSFSRQTSGSTTTSSSNNNNNTPNGGRVSIAIGLNSEGKFAPSTQTTPRLAAEGGGGVSAAAVAALNEEDPSSPPLVDKARIDPFSALATPSTAASSGKAMFSWDEEASSKMYLAQGRASGTHQSPPAGPPISQTSPPKVSKADLLASLTIPEFHRKEPVEGEDGGTADASARGHTSGGPATPSVPPPASVTSNAPDVVVVAAMSAESTAKDTAATPTSSASAVTVQGNVAESSIEATALLVGATSEAAVLRKSETPPPSTTPRATQCLSPQISASTPSRRSFTAEDVTPSEKPLLVSATPRDRLSNSNLSTSESITSADEVASSVTSRSRKGLALAQAIENDQYFERQMTGGAVEPVVVSAAEKNYISATEAVPAKVAVETILSAADSQLVFAAPSSATVAVVEAAVEKSTAEEPAAEEPAAEEPTATEHTADGELT